MRGARLAHKPIWAALTVGLVLIAFALFVKQAGTLPDGNGQLAIASGAPERSFVPVADANSDGVPDWQESLLRTVTLAATTSASTTDWNPTTLTERFSTIFFETLVRNETYGPLSQPNEQIVLGATEALARQAEDTLLTERDVVTTTANDRETLRTYGNAIADVILKYPYEGENETVILQNALRANDPKRLNELRPLLDNYRSMVIDMKTLPVPTGYLGEHLNLLNSYQAIANDIEAMEKVFSDPLYAMLRFKRYEDDVIGMTAALVALNKKLTTQGGVTFGSQDSMTILLPNP